MSRRRSQAPTARVVQKKCGSLAIEGLREVVLCDGTVRDVSDRSRVLLCGCGRSTNPPFCSGAHNLPPSDARDH